ncbi:hypothetical protein C8J57DRAFT_1535047 [Mycena rebaudengoi]|nr:hypothetical protein C8J57DRAFT_1535047 [Mycena rebaudengoi]
MATARTRCRDSSKRHPSSSTIHQPPSSRSYNTWACASPGNPVGFQNTGGFDPDPSQSSCTGGSNPPFSKLSRPAAGTSHCPDSGAVPPVEVVDALESEDNDPVIHTPPPRYSEKGKARATSEEINELESDEGKEKTPVPPCSSSPYVPVVGPEDFELDVESPPPAPSVDPAVQASTSNLDDPRQPVPPRPPVPPQMSFLGVPLEAFADPRVFNMEMLAHDTAALLQYYNDHPMEDRLEVHAYLEALFWLVGNKLRGGDVELHISDWAQNAGSSSNPGGS